jgi:hypothetical protein
MKMKRVLLMTTLVLALGLVASVARADNIDTVTMNFASGATFTGTVAFAPDYSYVTGVVGTLTGYQFGTAGPLGSGSDAISWVWQPVGFNFAADPGNFGTYLGDGAGFTSYDPFINNLIQFTYSYGDGFPILVSTDSNFIGPANGVLYIDPTSGVDALDPMTSGSIVATPEPGSLLLLGAGLAILLKARLKK